jgi:hypothetical protein
MMINVTFQMDSDNLEGAGSFYQRPLLTYLYALAKGYSFTPIKNPHSSCHYQDLEYEKIAQDWEDIFCCLGAPQTPKMPIVPLDDSAKLRSDCLYHVPFGLSYSYLEKMSPKERGALLEKIQILFKEHIYKYPKFKSPRLDGTVIALHLRDRSKGDPAFSKKTLLDWQMFSIDYGLPDNNPDYYSKLYAHAINKIILENAIEKPILHIHSTGEDQSFRQLLSLLDKKIEVRLFLNAHPPQSFLDLVLSDYLIASHSSFSWLASLLHSGPTYIRKNFRHFITPETTEIEEILYKNKSWLERLLIRVKMKISYYLFKKFRAH